MPLDKKRILKTAEEKQQVTHKDKPIRENSRFLNRDPKSKENME
jgi:hypothetical protein